MKLTPKQARFVEEYLVDLNASAAARRAGYSPRTADAIGRENLGKPTIEAAIAERQAARSERTQITADRVLLELARLAFFDLRKAYKEDGTLKLPHEIDDETAAGLASLETLTTMAGGGGDEAPLSLVTKKLKTFDKKGALELCMRHLGMFEKDNNQVAGGFVDLLARLNGRG